jgi:K+ transporter
MEIDRNLESNDTARHAAHDRKWPLPARVLVAVALLPVWAAFLLASEGDFSVIGAWFEPLIIALIVATVIVVWTTTAHSQR